MERNTNPYRPQQAGDRIGQEVSRWRLTERIAAGGFGEVWKAAHLDAGPPAAIKLLLPDKTGPLDIARFRREATVLASLNHENILRILDFGATPTGELYLATELLEGRTLGQLQRANGGRLRVEDAVYAARKMLLALEHAHRRGIVHRDIKPDNLFVCSSQTDESVAIKLIDFGIFKALRSAQALDGALTLEGQVPGTVQYMSPEQLRGEPIDGRSDLYATGIMLYRCLSGSSPYRADGVESAVFAHVHQEPTLLEHAAPELPRGLCAIVMRALAKDPAKRFASAADMERALAQLVQGPGEDPTSPDTIAAEPTHVLHVAPRHSAPELDLRLPPPPATGLRSALTNTSAWLRRRPVIAFGSGSAALGVAALAAVCSLGGEAARCTWCPPTRWATEGSAEACACQPQAAACACRQAPGSVRWCRDCAAGRAVAAGSAAWCGCRRALGEIGPAYCAVCKDKTCPPPPPPPPPPPCRSPRLSADWCRGCPEAGTLPRCQDEWRTCQIATGSTVEAICASCPEANGCRVPPVNPCVAHRRLSREWCAECEEAKGFVKGSADYCACHPGGCKPPGPSCEPFSPSNDTQCKKCPQGAKTQRGSRCYCLARPGDPVCEDFK